MREIQFRETSADTESNTILTELIIDLLKVREGTAESSGATRFSNTSVRHKKAILCGSLVKVFSKGAAHELRRIPVSHLKTLSG